MRETWLFYFLENVLQHYTNTRRIRYVFRQLSSHFRSRTTYVVQLLKIAVFIILVLVWRWRTFPEDSSRSYGSNPRSKHDLCFGEDYPEKQQQVLDSETFSQYFLNNLVPEKGRNSTMFIFILSSSIP